MRLVVRITNYLRSTFVAIALRDMRYLQELSLFAKLMSDKNPNFLYDNPFAALRFFRVLSAAGSVSERNVSERHVFRAHSNARKTPDSPVRLQEPLRESPHRPKRARALGDSETREILEGRRSPVKAP